MSLEEELLARIEALEEQVRYLASAISRHGILGVKPGDNVPTIIERLEKLERSNP